MAGQEFFAQPTDLFSKEIQRLTKAFFCAKIVG
jgi:hypothetical protein